MPRGYELTLPLPTLVPPQAPELDWDESTKQREGREKETCIPNLNPLGKVGTKEEQGAGKYQSHMLGRGQVSGAQGFLEREELGTDGFCCRYDRFLLWVRGEEILPPLNTGHKATEAAGQGRIILKGVHNPNLHSLSSSLCPEIQLTAADEQTLCSSPYKRKPAALTLCTDVKKSLQSRPKPSNNSKCVDNCYSWTLLLRPEQQCPKAPCLTPSGGFSCSPLLPSCMSVC